MRSPSEGLSQGVREACWCLGSDSNRHPFQDRILSPARLPITPPRPAAHYACGRSAEASLADPPVHWLEAPELHSHAAAFTRHASPAAHQYRCLLSAVPLRRMVRTTVRALAA